ncbi:Na+/H+ antiporter [Acetobacter thailandicus]|uniref:Na+/H+ antiporter n=1 Tax=Acetobacter thailandicus TaxID=1502842 RepID=UPI0024B20FD5|nr:Na+/H+ antiporter [Acetobacter thailandicus]
MQETLLALSLIAITGLTGVTARMLRLRVPMPLIQITVGAGASLAGLNVGLDSELFLLLFISPLLFADAYCIPMREFGELRNTIFAMAIGLVIVSTAGGGMILHWLMPAIPLAAAFALAGALSPTDAISVSGILRGGSVPPRLLNLLQGEALLNDASGLVCFKFAVAATTTGLFSLKTASANFVWVAAGGIVTGIVIGFLLSRLEAFLLRAGLNDPSSYTLQTLMAPFAIYLIAEHIETSGILAVVSAGMTMRMSGIMNKTRIETRLQTTAVWEIAGFTLNGIVFLLLGLQLPSLIVHAQQVRLDGGFSPWEIPLAIIALQVTMSLIRFIWVVLSDGCQHLVAHLRQRIYAVLSWPEKLVLALSGTRGTITLAAALSLPGDTEFPERALIITIAAGVIVTSLLLASFSLPYMLKILPAQGESGNAAQQEIDDTRATLVTTAITLLQREATRNNDSANKITPDMQLAHDTAVPLLLHEYQEQLQSLDSQQSNPDKEHEFSLRNRRAELALRLMIIRAQRDTLHRLLRKGKINNSTESIFVREMDIHEQELHNEAKALPHASTP